MTAEFKDELRREIMEDDYREEVMQIHLRTDDDYFANHIEREYGESVRALMRCLKDSGRGDEDLDWFQFLLEK